MSGWRWSRPAMQLHPAHFETGQPGVQPLRLSEVELLLTQRMPPSDVMGQVHDQSVVVHASPGTDAVLRHVPLLGLEVSLVESSSGEEQPFIVISHVDGPFTSDVEIQGGAKAWLFKSQDGLEVAKRLLEAMGANGAVRKDLEISWDPTPLASGGAASVHMATSSFRGSMQTCVIKMFGQEAGETQSRALQEVAILARAQNSLYVVQMLGLWTASVSPGEGQACGLLMECCSKGDAQMATNERPFQETHALDIICDVLQGISHLHMLGIIHRDIKAANILLRETGPPVLADFGLACLVSDRERVLKRCGSPGYVAPEIITGKGASTKSDIFSAGCTLYFLISGKPAFGRLEDDVGTVLACTIGDSLKFKDPVFAFVSTKCKRFLKKLTTKSVSVRPSAPQALAMQWTLSSSDGTDVEEELATRRALRPARPELSAIESLPSVQELHLQARTSSSPWAHVNSDSDNDGEPCVMPRSYTMSPSQRSSRPRQAVRSKTSDA